MKVSFDPEIIEETEGDWARGFLAGLRGGLCVDEASIIANFQRGYAVGEKIRQDGAEFRRIAETVTDRLDEARSDYQARWDFIGQELQDLAGDLIRRGRLAGGRRVLSIIGKMRGGIDLHPENLSWIEPADDPDDDDGRSE